MSVARGYGLNGRAIYANVTKLMLARLQFTVTPTNGLGITSLKSNGFVENVFMHTSTTPASNGGFLNPNPANGFALVQMKQNFNVFLGMNATFVTPTTGSTQIDNGATLTVGQVYVISTLGNATAAQWTTVGVPAGVTPAVGVSFVAIATGAGSGATSTSRVATPTSSTTPLVEVVGVTNNQTTSNIASNSGQWVTVQFSKPAGAFTGSALANHAHDLLIKGGQAASTTNDVAMYSGPLIGKEQASDATVVGGSSTNGGVQNASAGTPAGTVALTYAPAAPATGSICMMDLWWDGSTVTIDGL